MPCFLPTDGTFLYVPPNRYVFRGADFLQDLDQLSDGALTSSSDDSDDDDDAGDDISDVVESASGVAAAAAAVGSGAGGGGDAETQQATLTEASSEHISSSNHHHQHHHRHHQAASTLNQGHHMDTHQAVTSSSIAVSSTGGGGCGDSATPTSSPSKGDAIIDAIRQLHHSDVTGARTSCVVAAQEHAAGSVSDVTADVSDVTANAGNVVSSHSENSQTGSAVSRDVSHDDVGAPSKRLKLSSECVGAGDDVTTQ